MNKVSFFDAHFHIIDPSYPLTANQGFLPEAYEASDYLKETHDYQKKGGAIVSGSFQGFDQDYLIKALETLGPNYFGVTQLPYSVKDETLDFLNKKGVRAIRFNCKRGGSESVEHLVDFAKRVYDLHKWHIELYIESRHLKPLIPLLLKCPKVSIDHLGLTEEGFEDLLSLVKENVKVKATGFSRLNFSVEKALQEIHKVNSNALLFGTDLPSTRAPKRFSKQDIDLILKLFGIDDQNKILHQNAHHFYNGS